MKTGTADNPYRYRGYTFDSESGLYYLNARVYDPELARFMQEDTYRGQKGDPLSLNLYTYCKNNPITYWDPSGRLGMEYSPWNPIPMKTQTANEQQQYVNAVQTTLNTGGTVSNTRTVSSLNVGNGTLNNSGYVGSATVNNGTINNSGGIGTVTSNGGNSTISNTGTIGTVTNNDGSTTVINHGTIGTVTNNGGGTTVVNNGSVGEAINNGGTFVVYGTRPVKSTGNVRELSYQWLIEKGQSLMSGGRIVVSLMGTSQSSSISNGWSMMPPVVTDTGTWTGGGSGGQILPLNPPHYSMLRPLAEMHGGPDCIQVLPDKVIVRINNKSQEYFYNRTNAHGNIVIDGRLWVKTKEFAQYFGLIQTEIDSGNSVYAVPDIDNGLGTGRVEWYFKVEYVKMPEGRVVTSQYFHVSGYDWSREISKESPGIGHFTSIVYKNGNTIVSTKLLEPTGSVLRDKKNYHYYYNGENKHPFLVEGKNITAEVAFYVEGDVWAITGRTLRLSL